MSWDNCENKRLAARADRRGGNKTLDHQNISARDKNFNLENDEFQQRHKINFEKSVKEGAKSSSKSSTSNTITSITKSIKKTFSPPKTRKKNQDSYSTAYESIRSDSISSRSIDSFSSSNSLSEIELTSEPDKLENELFLRRLFKKYNPNDQQHQLNTKYCQTKTIGNTTWSTFTFAQSNSIFIELGHTNLNSMSRHDIVDLIDETILNDKIDKLVFYYSENRSDAKNLNRVFSLMDFNKMPVENINFMNLDQNLVVNDFNNYWVYDTCGEESGNNSSGSEFSEEEDDDFF